MAGERMRIGIDLGGTKTEAIALAEDGLELQRRRVPTVRGDYGVTLQTIVSLVAELEKELGQTGTVGVGIPGAVSPATGRIKNANSTWLIGRDLQRDLGQALGREVRLANDANCFAVSEATDGAARGAAVVFGVIVGTGTGGAVVVDGRPLTGCNAIAGEWGHNPLPWPLREELPGPECYCGKHGCIETWLSGPGFEEEYARHAVPPRSAAEIVRLAEQGDSVAAAVLHRYQDRMARSLATVINLLDPEVIVLGGGISNIEQLYSVVPRLWTNYVFSDRVDTRLVPPLHGDSSGVRGAAWLWPPQQR